MLQKTFLKARTADRSLVDQLLIHGRRHRLIGVRRKATLRCSMRCMTVQIVHPYQRTARSRACQYGRDLRQLTGHPGSQVTWPGAFMPP